MKKQASIRPALKASASVGKSVKRFDSNRVDLLVLDAKSVTGQVRCQVTGRKPTVRLCRLAMAESTFVAAIASGDASPRQGLNLAATRAR